MYLKLINVYISIIVNIKIENFYLLTKNQAKMIKDHFENCNGYLNDLSKY